MNFKKIKCKGGRGLLPSPKGLYRGQKPSPTPPIIYGFKTQWSFMAAQAFALKFANLKSKMPLVLMAQALYDLSHYKRLLSEWQAVREAALELDLWR